MNSSRRLIRPSALVGAVLAVALSLSSCAKDATVSADPVAQTTVVSSDATSAPDPAVPGDGIEIPTGPNDEVLKVETGLGGFRTFQATFAEVPSILVTGDGRVFTEGPVSAVFPGPFLPNIQVARVDPEVLRRLMGAANNAGLLGEIPDYSVGRPPVTDVGSTALTLVANGKTYVHDAYALGMEQGDAPARKALKDFIEAARTALTALPSERFLPATYLLATRDAGISTDSAVDPTSGEPQPRLQLWPGDIGVDLKDLTCAPVEASKVQALFGKADQMTYFFQDSGVYSLAVRPVLPGQPGCESLQ